MWGAPGTMLAAEVVHAESGDERFAEAWRQSADRLWGEWRYDPEAGYLWTQQSSTAPSSGSSAPHTDSREMCACCGGRRLLDPDRAAQLEQRAVATATGCAIHSGGLEPASAPGSEASRSTPRSRRAGTDCLLADVATGDAAFTALLCGGGELVWQAGPLEKGHGLCHGTAGNGYALLALHRRTGDVRWLERARAFAMQAISNTVANQ